MYMVLLMVWKCVLSSRKAIGEHFHTVLSKQRMPSRISDFSFGPVATVDFRYHCFKQCFLWKSDDFNSDPRHCLHFQLSYLLLAFIPMHRKW